MLISLISVKTVEQYLKLRNLKHVVVAYDFCTIEMFYLNLLLEICFTMGNAPDTNHTTNPTKRKMKTTRELTFLPGESNPILFLTEFQKCSDVKADSDLDL